MPHQVEITGIRAEHLQDITDEECLKEGILPWNADNETEAVVKKNILEFTDRFGHTPYQIPKCWNVYESPRKAYADLIDKICGKGTWEWNPLVWVYDFVLVK